jgi:hypothetical protein
MAETTGGPVTLQVAKNPARHFAADNLLAYARDRVAAAQAVSKDHLIKRVFRLPRLDLTVWFASEALAAFCESRLFQHREASPALARAEIYVLDAGLAGWTPPEVWPEQAGFSSRSFEQSLAVGNLRGFYHHEGPSWQFFDPVQGVGIMTLSSALGIPPWETGSPLRLFLHWAYAAAGLRLVHAATLGLGGEGVLISGASGSGKSGTTLAGFLNGLDTVGDDYVLIEDGAAPTAYPVFRLFKQDTNGLRRVGLDENTTGNNLLNWHGKIEFDAADRLGKPLVDRMRIRAIFIPAIARLQRSRIEPADARSAALSIAPSGVFQLPGDSASGLRFLAAVVRKLPAFRLMLSEDPAEIADAIHSFLSKGHALAG